MIVSSLILAVNAFWDMLCAVCMFIDIPPFNSAAHVSLWNDPADRENPAARHLMSCFVLTWGCMRIACLMGMGNDWAVLSYVIECFVFASGSLFSGRMHIGKGMFVALGSLALAFYFSFGVK